MSDSYLRLSAAVPRPAHPVDAASMDVFRMVEAVMRLRLPIDYKLLICAYGNGSWLNFLWPLNPCSTNENLNLLQCGRRTLEGERTLRSQWPNDVPFALYPEPEGLLPWALTDNGNRLFWQTAGEPTAWPLVVYEPRGPRYASFAMDCCTFLLKWVGGELDVPVFPKDFDYGYTNAFEPLRVNREVGEE